MAIGIAEVEGVLRAIFDGDPGSSEAFLEGREVVCGQGEQVARARALALPAQALFQHEHDVAGPQPHRAQARSVSFPAQLGKAEEAGVEGRRTVRVGDAQGKVVEGGHDGALSLPRPEERIHPDRFPGRRAADPKERWYAVFLTGGRRDR